MKEYHVTFSDDQGAIHGIRLWAHNEEQARAKAVIKINAILTIPYQFVDEDIVAIEIESAR